MNGVVNVFPCTTNQANWTWLSIFLEILYWIHKKLSCKIWQAWDNWDGLDDRKIQEVSLQQSVHRSHYFSTILQQGPIEQGWVQGCIV